jgi:magnesium chelatase accessory protein
MSGDGGRFLCAGGVHWHVQCHGRGPVMLLVHGTGASTHSWRALVPRLAERFTVVVPDLPGHGDSAAPACTSAYSLDGMADALARLLEVLVLAPVVAVGHSAGAAVLARMQIDGAIAARRLVFVNAALLPWHGVRRRVFAPAARLLAASDGVARFFARRARDVSVIQRLLASIGSPLDPDGVEHYARLAQRPAHVAAALRMMAGWRIETLADELVARQSELVLIEGDRDRAIAARVRARLRRRLPAAQWVTLPGAGHLAHEEQPAQVVELVLRAAAEVAS